MNVTALSRRTPLKAALLGLPLAIAAAVAFNPGEAFSAAPDAPVPARFERVQFADVIEAVSPAVVQITVEKQFDNVAMQGRPPFAGGGAFEEFLRRFGATPFGHPGRPGHGAPARKATGVGSGFIIDDDGHIVTNNHVIDDATEMTVTLADGRELDARLVGSDPLTDLALIKVDEADLPAIAFGDSDRIRVGDWVVAIGSPFGFGGSATAGIISARGRDIRSGPYDDFLQIDAPINSGNSGGPIVDANGKVVGVNTAIFSPTGGNVGIGFAIPAREARHIVEQLKADGSVTRGWLGVQIQPLTDDVAEALGLDTADGALVAEVVSDGPAARAGIRAGDVIVRYGTETVTSPRELSHAVARTEPGSKTPLTVVRKGQEKRVTAVIDQNRARGKLARSDDGATSDDALGLGLALGSLSDEARREMRIDEDVDGALVLGIKSGSAADAGGIRPGDVIVQVNQDAVTDATAAEQALTSARRAERPAVVLIRRGNSQFFTTIDVA